jgi:uncharacterized RDD family membrane protein YckC
MTDIGKEIDGVSNILPILESNRLARAWPRFWARTFDLLLFGSIFWVIFAIVSPATLTSYNVATQGNMIVDSMVTLLAGLFFEVIFCSALGNTPGKWLSGLKLEKLEGGMISFKTFLDRNTKIWLSGYGLGIPILNLVRLNLAYKRVLKGELTTWDKSLGTRVWSVNSNSTRTTIVAVLVLSLNVGLFYLAELGKKLNTTNDITADSFSEQFAKQIAVMNAQTPSRIDEITTLTGVSFEDSVLNYNYQISPEAENKIRENLFTFRTNILLGYCKNFEEEIKAGTLKGVVANYQIGSVPLDNISANFTSCGFEKKVIE